MRSSNRLHRAAAAIRRLACLNAGGPQFAPLLLQELESVLNFDSSGYFYLGEGGQPEFYSAAEEVRAIVPLYLDERMQAEERKVARPFSLAAYKDFGPQLREQLIMVSDAEFARSDYYNLLLRPPAIDDCVSLVPRLAGHRPAGALKFYRRPRRPRFRREELACLAQLEPFMARLLQPHQPSPAAAPDAEALQGKAFLVATPQGRVLWQSAEAGALMAVAFGPHWRQGDGLPQRCAAVLDRLRQVRAGAEQPDFPQTAWHDARGTFIVRASTLSAASGSAEAVALEIEHRLPRRLLLLQRLKALALPDRQFEIAYWLAQGEAEPPLAARLGISLNTLVYHRRRLYERLAVHSRKELLALFAKDPAAGHPRGNVVERGAVR